MSHDKIIFSINVLIAIFNFEVAMRNNYNADVNFENLQTLGKLRGWRDAGSSKDG